MIKSILSFDLAGRRYGLPVENVQQIVEMVATTPLPAAPACIVGVIDFHGQVIPVADMRRHFNQPVRPYTLRTPIVVSRLNGRSIGLVVDGVTGTVQLRPEQIKSASQIVIPCALTISTATSARGLSGRYWWQIVATSPTRGWRMTPSVPS